jgi:prepilin-type processing-associated H-X9-DG protein
MLWLDSYYQHITPPNSLPCAWDFAVSDGIASKPPSSAHPGGVHVLLVDGSLRFVSDDIDEAAWREMGSRDSDDDFERL